MREQLLEDASQVLQNNWRNGFTVPTARLYPFQWFWDSGFISLGWAKINLTRAMTEIESLLAGQWANGMIPHIIFHDESQDTYFPNWDFWFSQSNPQAPRHIKTSGITQPPVLGFIIEELVKKYGADENINDFAKKSIPKIIDNHRFFYRYRDPYGEGLFYIYHPWESGRDNSPIWESILDKIDLDKIKLPAYQRRDTQVTDQILLWFKILMKSQF